MELGEKNNSYFLGLEKKRQAKKSLNKLKDENGDIICEQTELLKEIKRYYEPFLCIRYCQCLCVVHS